jgi:hypothetical protein
MGARIPLALGPLELSGAVIPRSGFTWTCEDGQFCKAGDLIAFCKIAIVSASNTEMMLNAFTGERHEFQAALVLNTNGRVFRHAQSSDGGFIDRLARWKSWVPGFVLGYLEPEQASEQPPLRLMLGAGRRVTEHAEVRSGFLTGWHMRNRAWWADGPTVEGTLLGVGSCEISSVLVGDGAPFLDMLGLAPGFAQVVMQPDQALAPCARVTLEQMQRTPEQMQAITEAFFQEFSALSTPPGPADWIFAGVLLASLQESPLSAETHVLSQGGLQSVAAPDAVFTSVGSEPRRLFRHRRLGYIMNIHSYRIATLSPAMTAWLRENFEPLVRDADDIKADLSALIAHTRQASPMAFMIMNAMSTDGNEDIATYSPFEAPMGRTLSAIHHKELNLVLHDLARSEDVSIIDQDAIAADIGAARHLPDGTHQSGVLLSALREELLWTLEQRQIPGFCAPPQTTSKLTAMSARSAAA